MPRLSFVKYEGAIASWKKEAAGNGATGQIKKAGWFGRSIKITVNSQIGTKAVQESIDFNRGSLCDWLKSRGHKVEKGNWCCGGDDDETIIKLFNAEMKKQHTEAIDPELSALEQKARSGKNSDIVAFVTECLKTKPIDYTHRYWWARNEFDAAISNKDYQTALDIKQLFFENGYAEVVFDFTLRLAKRLMRSDLYMEVSTMYRNGTGTAVDVASAEFYNNKAIEIKQNKEGLDIEIQELETKVNNDISYAPNLVQAYLESNPPYFEKAKKQFEDAKNALDDTRMYKIAEAFSNCGYSSEADRLFLEIKNSTKQANILRLETQIKNGNPVYVQLLAEFLAGNPNDTDPYYKKALELVEQVRINKDDKLLYAFKDIFQHAEYATEAFNITLEMAENLKTAQLYIEVSRMFRNGFGTDVDPVQAKHYDDLASAARNTKG